MNTLDTPGTGFADRSLVRNYLETGTMPSIHDNIEVLLAKIPAAERRGAIDLGACTGLITVRAFKLGFSPVIGVEPRAVDVAVFDEHLKRAGCELCCRKINPMDPENLRWLSGVMLSNGCTTVIARRILPEILGGTVDSHDPHTVHPEAGDRLGKALLEGGATRIIVEGRVPSPRARHDLSSVEQEIVAMSRYWLVADRLKACAMLVPR